MMNKLLAFLALSLPACQPAETTQPDQQFLMIPVDDRFSFGTVEWSNHGGSVDCAFITTDTDGVMNICGAVSHGKLNAKTLTNQWLRCGAILQNGEILFRDVRYFKDAGYNQPLLGKPANCRAVAGLEPGEVTLRFDAMHRRLP